MVIKEGVNMMGCNRTLECKPLVEALVEIQVVVSPTYSLPHTSS